MTADMATHAPFQRGEPVTDERGREIVLPIPQVIEYGDYVPLDSACIVLRRDATQAERLGAREFANRVEQLGGRPPTILEQGSDTAEYSVQIIPDIGTPSDPRLAGLPEPRRSESYAITPRTGGGTTRILCNGGGPRGAFYAMMTLSQLANRKSDTPILRTARIRDWPALEMRLIAHDGAALDSDGRVKTYIGIMDGISRYKLNTFATGKDTDWRAWPDSSRSGPLRRWTASAANHARDTGLVDLLQYVHTGKRMTVSDRNELAAMQECLLFSLREGAAHVGVLADDIGQYTEADEKVFGPKYPSGWAASHAHMMNMIHEAVRAEFPAATILYCPPEWWPKGLSYAGPPWKMIGTQEFARRVPPDIGIIWTGHKVMWRDMPAGMLESWPAYMSGHKPFHWDNTIYSRWRRDLGTFVLFNPYDNSMFPPNLPDLLHKGIHLNSAPGALNESAWATFACYAWNPASYTDPWLIMDLVLRKEYGPGLAALFHEFRETYVDLLYNLGRLYTKRLSDPTIARMPGTAGGQDKPVDRSGATAMHGRLRAILNELKALDCDPRITTELDRDFVTGRPELLADTIEDRFFGDEAETIRDFDVVGPFPNDQGAGLDTPYPPETETKVAGTAERQTAGWEKKHLPPEDNFRIRDYLSFPQSGAVWYAVASIESDNDRSGTLLVKTFSPIRIFANGKETYASETDSGPGRRDAIRLHKASVPLKKGANRLLFKIAAGAEPAKILVRVRY